VGRLNALTSKERRAAVSGSGLFNIVYQRLELVFFREFQEFVPFWRCSSEFFDRVQPLGRLFIERNELAVAVEDLA
jgi:hypothetical protein